MSSEKKPTKNRIIEIDLLRGVAVMAMVIYHLLFILDYFANPEHPFTRILVDFIKLENPVITLFAQAIRITFISLVGISLWLSFQLTTERFSLKQLKRSVQIGFLALLISVSTYFFDPSTMVRFGVLHLIAVSVVLSVPFVSRPRLSLLAGTLISLLGFKFMPIITSTPFLY